MHMFILTYVFHYLFETDLSFPDEHVTSFVQ